MTRAARRQPSTWARASPTHTSTGCGDRVRVRESSEVHACACVCPRGGGRTCGRVQHATCMCATGMQLACTLHAIYPCLQKHTCQAEVVLSSQQQQVLPVSAVWHPHALVGAKPLKLGVSLCRARLVVSIRSIASSLQPSDKKGAAMHTSKKWPRVQPQQGGTGLCNTDTTHKTTSTTQVSVNKEIVRWGLATQPASASADPGVW